MFTSAGHFTSRFLSKKMRVSVLRPTKVLEPRLTTCRRAFASSDDREREKNKNATLPPKLRKPPRNPTEVLINREGLLPTRMHHGEDKRPPLEGLAKELEQMIMLNGPITVAEYMIYALQHPKYGYYMRPMDKIGRDGDFITAPEISQVGCVSMNDCGLLKR